MRTRMLSCTLALGLAVALVTMASAQTDMMIGTWKLNIAKSKYSPGPGPKSATLVIAGTDQARKLTMDATPASGPVQHWEVSGATDMELKVTGNNPNADTYMLKRINATTIEAHYKKGGKPTLTQTGSGPDVTAGAWPSPSGRSSPSPVSPQCFIAFPVIFRRSDFRSVLASDENLSSSDRTSHVAVGQRFRRRRSWHGSRNRSGGYTLCPLRRSRSC